MGQQDFLFNDFLKMGSKFKKGIYCTKCKYLNNVSKLIKQYDNCKKCYKIFEIQLSENMDENVGTKKNHVKDFKVKSVMDNYVNEVQIIVIERIDKTSAKLTCDDKQIKSRKRNLSSCREILSDSSEEVHINNDFRDVT